MKTNKMKYLTTSKKESDSIECAKEEFEGEYEEEELRLMRIKFLSELAN